MVSRRAMAFGFLMTKYGNGGSCCSADNHKFIKALYEGREEDAQKLLHRITCECKKAYERIENGDYSELSESQIASIEKKLHWAKVMGIEDEVQGE